MRVRRQGELGGRAGALRTKALADSDAFRGLSSEDVPGADERTYGTDLETVFEKNGEVPGAVFLRYVVGICIEIRREMESLCGVRTTRPIQCVKLNSEPVGQVEFRGWATGPAALAISGIVISLACGVVQRRAHFESHGNGPGPVWLGEEWGKDEDDEESKTHAEVLGTVLANAFLLQTMGVDTTVLWRRGTPVPDRLDGQSRVA